jgi:phospholipid N-methyltransferase
MIVRAFENWARFEDNGIWEYPHIYSTIVFTKLMTNVRAKLIDEVIYIMRTDGPAYKISLEMYTPAQQNKIIDALYQIIE